MDSYLKFLGIRYVSAEDLTNNISKNMGVREYVKFCRTHINTGAESLPPLFTTGVDMVFLTPQFIEATQSKLREISGDKNLKFGFAVAYHELAHPYSWAPRYLLPATTFSFIETNGIRIAGPKFSNFGNGVFKIAQERPHAVKKVEEGKFTSQYLENASQLLRENGYACQVIASSIRQLLDHGFAHVVAVYPDLSPSLQAFEESLTVKSLRSAGGLHAVVGIGPNSPESSYVPKKKFEVATPQAGVDMAWCFDRQKTSGNNDGKDLAPIFSNSSLWELIKTVAYEIEKSLSMPHEPEVPVSGTEFVIRLINDGLVPKNCRPCLEGLGI